MRHDHFSMLPEKAFQPRNGRQGMTLEGGGGSPGPQTNTTYTSNIPEWLRPQTEALLGAATQEYFQTKRTSGTPDRIERVYNPQTEAYEDRVIKGTPGKTQIVGVKPYVPFSENKEDYVAQFTPLQKQVFEEGAKLKTDDAAFAQASDITRGAASGAVGYGQQGLGFGQQGAGFGQQAAGFGGLYERMATDPYSVQAYMSPYMQQVVERQKQAAIEDAQRSNLAANLGVARQGTYGGARQLLAQTQREAALGKQMGDIQAAGLQSAFDRAVQAQQFGIQTGLQGLQTGIQGAQTGIQGAQTGLQGVGLVGQMGAQLGNIATAQQQANLERLGFQRELGAEQRAREQAIIDQQIQDFAMAQQYPFQQLSAYSGLLRGYATPTTSVSQYKAAPSGITQLAGTGIQLGGAAQALGLGGKAGGQVKQFKAGGIAETEGLADMLSIPQLAQSIKNDSVPEYIGIPLLEEKVDMAERMKLAQGIAPEMEQQVPIADKVMARAAALEGIDSVQGAAGGGMVAFDKGGIARFQNTGLVGIPSWDELQVAPDEPIVPGAEMSRFVKSLSPDRRKVDPVTGKLVTLGEYLRLSDQRKAAAFATPPNQAALDEYPGIDFTDADVAKALGKTPQVPGQGGITDVANQGNKAGPARQGGPSAPGGLGETPAQKELSRAELFAQREKEQRELLGEDPRIKKMQESLKRQSEEPFLDRMLRGLQLVAAGSQLKEEGKTEQLEKAMANEAARRAEIAKREEKQAELEGAEYQRKAGIYEKVAEEDREKAKTKEERAFREKLVRLQKSLEPQDFNNRLLDMAMGKSGSKSDQEFAKKVLEGRSKSTTLTYEDAAKIVDDRIKNNFTLIGDIQKREQAAGRPVPDADTIRRRLIEEEMTASGARAGNFAGFSSRQLGS